MATTYFGYCNSSTGAGTGTVHCGFADKTDWTTAGYACPGTGNQTLVTLGIEADAAGGGNLRMAIYSGTALICYAGGTEKASIVGWLSWTNAELTWVVGTTLVGGTTYKLVFTSDANTGALGTGGLPADTMRYLANDYTGSAWPDPIAAGTGYTTEYNIRCGVEPAAGGVAYFNWIKRS